MQNLEKKVLNTQASKKNQTTRRAAITSVLSGLSTIKTAQSVAALSGLSALGMSTSGCMGETTYDQSKLGAYEPFWTYRADRLEKYQVETFNSVRTKDDPQGHKVESMTPASGLRTRL